jgi:hypothetical protein
VSLGTQTKIKTIIGEIKMNREQIMQLEKDVFLQSQEISQLKEENAMLKDSLRKQKMKMTVKHSPGNFKLSDHIKD